MKKILFTIALMIFSWLSSAAQEKMASAPQSGNDYAAPGTYQLIFHPCKFKYVYSRELLIEIEKKRDAEKDQTIHMNPCVDVLIPSRKKIQAADFIPLDEMKEASD